jgi:hypothetical protein
MCKRVGHSASWNEVCIEEYAFSLVFPLLRYLVEGTEWRSKIVGDGVALLLYPPRNISPVDNTHIGSAKVTLHSGWTKGKVGRVQEPETEKNAGQHVHVDFCSILCFLLLKEIIR